MIVMDCFECLADLLHDFLLEHLIEHKGNLIGNLHLIERHLLSLLSGEIPCFAGAGSGFEFGIALRALFIHNSVHRGIHLRNDDIVIRNLADDGLLACGDQADLRAKIALFCNIPRENAIPNLTAPVLYEVPLMLEREGLADVVVRRLGLICHMPDLTEWATMVHRAKHPQGSVEIALVGKYVALHDAYLSVAEALTHGGIENDVKVNIRWVDSETVTDGNAAELLDGADGVLVPGGFGSRGIEGKIAAVRWARESRVPFLGICLGMQMAVVEYARHVCGWADAHSSELDPATTHPVIDLMPDQRGVTAKGGTMRLGAYPCKVVSRGSRTYQAYGAEEISERHRHRYEFNNEYRDALTQAGLELLYNSSDVGTELKVVGIARSNGDSTMDSSSMLAGSVGYTSALTTYAIETVANSDIVKAQLDDPDTDVLCSLPFPGSRSRRRTKRRRILRNISPACP